MVLHDKAGGGATSTREPTQKRRADGQQPRSDAKRSEPTIFLARLYEMVNDAKTDQAIQWSTIGGVSAFTITDNMLLEKHWLPKYYKHSNFTSFVRQLNQYQFRKVEPKRWSFAHESFIKNRPDLLVRITRKRKDFGSAKQSSPKKAATGVASDTSKLEVCVKQLSDTLSRVVEQQREMQAQLNSLTERVYGPSTGQTGEVKKDRTQTVDDSDSTMATMGLPPSVPSWSLLNQQASLVEFADVEIPADIDSILSPAKPIGDEQQQQQQQQRGQQVVPPPPPKEHPLQLPRPSTLFQASY